MHNILEITESSIQQKPTNKKLDLKKCWSFFLKMLFVLLIITLGITSGLCVKVIFTRIDAAYSITLIN